MWGIEPPLAIKSIALSHGRLRARCIVRCRGSAFGPEIGEIDTTVARKALSGAIALVKPPVQFGRQMTRNPAWTRERGSLRWISIED